MVLHQLAIQLKISFDPSDRGQGHIFLRKKANQPYFTCHILEQHTHDSVGDTPCTVWRVRITTIYINAESFLQRPESEKTTTCFLLESRRPPPPPFFPFLLFLSATPPRLPFPYCFSSTSSSSSPSSSTSSSPSFTSSSSPSSPRP